ncbi:MAG: hypothetical protein ABF959_08630 [Gluconobacter albidus]
MSYGALSWQFWGVNDMHAQPFDPARLAPDVRRLLESSKAPRFESMTIPEMREAYRQIGAKLGGEPLAVGSVRDLQANGPAGPIPLRLYFPEVINTAHAATIYLHGGGWSIGDLDTHDRV